MFEKCGGDPSTAGHHTLRAWLVDGVTADLRFASRRPAQFLGHGLVRSPRLRLLVRGHGGLWALDQRARRQCPHCTRGGRLFRGCDLHSAAPRQAAIARLWHFVRRVARALFAQRHPQLVARLALDAMVWTGEGSPTLAERKKKLPEFRAKNRPPIDKAFIYSLFDRDHPSTAEEKVIDAFADAVTALDSSVPTGTYVDMCSNLPVVDPEKITVPTLIMRGQWDGIASFQDLLAFFARLPNPDKHFAVMPGISHASFQQNNYALVYHILWSFFTQPAPIYRG